MIEENEKILMQPGEVRVRIAPSPTGFLHIGTARVALFNYLFAKKYNGSFIIRIEDTDKERSKPEFEKDILENLRWLGLEWTEGPDIGGKYGPYRQSERLEIYERYIRKLLNTQKAYFCFCSKEDLKAQRDYLLSIGQPPRYSGKCRNLSKAKIEENLKKGKSFVIRFKVPLKKVEFEDLIRGKIEFDTSLIGDFVIAKDFKRPLYNLACVIDDFEMKISHVIRGEDHIPNTPKQILLYEALNLPIPKFAHLPLILGPDKSKLSKRHGAASISQYKKAGYLPEALVNFMAFLGWNPGTEREIYSFPSLVKDFSIEKVQKGGAIFNIKRLDYLNGFYIRRKSIEKLTQLCIPYLIQARLIEKVKGTKKKNAKQNPGEETKKLGLFKEEKTQFKIVETRENISLLKLQKIVSLYRERLKKLSEISELTDFFFKGKLEYQKELLRWKEASDKEIKMALDRLQKVLSKIKNGDWTKENLENVLLKEAENFALKIKKVGDRGYFLWPLRVALTGKRASAGPFEIAEILGKEKTIKRIKEARELLK